MRSEKSAANCIDRDYMLANDIKTAVMRETHTRREERGLAARQKKQPCPRSS